MKTVTLPQSLLLATLVVGMSVLPLTAATIANGGTATDVTAIGSGSTIGVAGYDLIGAGAGIRVNDGTVFSAADINNAPSYAMITGYYGTVRHTFDTTLTVDGSSTPTLTGDGGKGTGAYSTFATIGFTSAIDNVGTLRVGILVNNGPTQGFPADYVFSLNQQLSTLAGTRGIAETDDGNVSFHVYTPASVENDMLYVDITGLTSSDVLTIGGGPSTFPDDPTGDIYNDPNYGHYNPNNGFAIGAITFDATSPVVAPEPSTYALLALGLGVIALGRLRRKA